MLSVTKSKGEQCISNQILYIMMHINQQIKSLMLISIYSSFSCGLYRLINKVTYRTRNQDMWRGGRGACHQPWDHVTGRDTTGSWRHGSKWKRMNENPHDVPQLQSLRNKQPEKYTYTLLLDIQVWLKFSSLFARNTHYYWALDLKTAAGDRTWWQY